MNIKNKSEFEMIVNQHGRQWDELDEVMCSVALQQLTQDKSFAVLTSDGVPLFGFQKTGDTESMKLRLKDWHWLTEKQHSDKITAPN